MFGSPFRHQKSGIVPNGFGVSINLLYKGRPMFEQDPVSSGNIMDIQNNLRHDLEKLAKKYNLDYITPMDGKVYRI